MENKLVLKDGTEIKDGFASRSSRDQLMVRVPGNDLVKAATDFSNSEKTETIICYYSIYKTTFTGYTIIYSVQYFADGDYVEMWLEPAEGAKTSMKQEIIVPKEYVPFETAPEAEEVQQNKEEESNDGESTAKSNTTRKTRSVRKSS